MPDPFKIRLEIPLHLYCHPVFEQIFLLSQKFWWKGSQTLISIFTI
jgi:hypothetical protein